MEREVVVASPRGFCAGVSHAIEIVDLILEREGPPVYVRHEIVHNAHVVKRLEAMGAVFVEELDQAAVVARLMIFRSNPISCAG